MPSDATNHRTALATIAIVSAFVFLYSVILIQQILLGLVAVLSLFGLYFVWWLFKLLVRFVDAHERIADALEDR